ncbi:DEAD/DEAH box helicase [Catellatospora chokoriensis]|uniref:ATP-dependent helicase n=1 Tax=Catellatospora chokoriensis TaxID=310353 RepID=A0A8J3K7A3_9ACTN|nr:DEAD/DEAH box helicase [Catellatospora chokoriensis]GIF91533.1 ATP-dependent helicase [Catellatospora chokoriensis]
MTSWPPSASDRATRAKPQPPSSGSGAYELLHPAIQQWIYRKGWRRLHQAQEHAVRPILAGNTDVIVAAATAGGKTEAAWLPICSALLTQAEPGPRRPAGIRALYIGPLKALINDQYERLGELCSDVDLPVHRWHGDVAASAKTQLRRTPDGIVLITPESIEALFVQHGPQIPTMFAGLRYIVIDELHSFLGTERGAQLQSLQHRIELALRRRVPRIGLSATLGDFSTAADFLRPGHGPQVEIIRAVDTGAQVSLQVRGYTYAAPTGHTAPTRADRPAIAEHLVRTLRGTNNLIFANTRQDVETYTELLNRICIDDGKPQEFLPHHGSLAKDLREHAEARLKDGTTPVTAVCTSTLEMGVDIGSVASVAQIGPPPSVAALRQRLGRSGRRDDTNAVLRVYISEPATTDATPPTERLRTDLFQTVAAIEMLLAGDYETPTTTDLHLSTLIQQILSLLAQHSGVNAQQLHNALCGHGPFRNVNPSVFADLLRTMGERDLLMQDDSGQLLPAATGEKLINHHAFAAAFHTPTEYTLIAGGNTIGTLRADPEIVPGYRLVFAGRRWQVQRVDDHARIIELIPTRGGNAPKFSSGRSEVTDEVRQTMHALYCSQVLPSYLDDAARALFLDGRHAFHQQGHTTTRIIRWGTDTLLFPWRGDRIMNTIGAALSIRGLETTADGHALVVLATTPTQLYDALRDLAATPPPDPVELARAMDRKHRDKYDHYLSNDLLNRGYAASVMDVHRGWEALAEIAATPITR